ncbi:MAG TPA: c-type cytochrome [Gemmatimonadales bacterium]|nr:c-type cytochrome [Gemmatimonadales bacterium]
MRGRGLALCIALLVGCGEPEERADVLTAMQGSPREGRAAIQRYGCGACHRIPGIREARGLVGPPLSDLPHRAYLAGSLPNTMPNLQRWIRFPDEIRPGTVMPTLGVTEADARHIAAYLYLRTSTNPPGPPSPLPGSMLKSE